MTLGAGDQLLLRRGDLWRAGSGLSDGVSNYAGLRVQSANGATIGAYLLRTILYHMASVK